MKFAILIVTYTSPIQTLRLVKRLSNGVFDFYIHVDKKINIDTHKEVFALPNVYMVKDRIDINWGGYTLVEAVLSGIKEIVASKIAYTSIKFISGQDYPIKPTAYILDFFKKNVGKEFVLYENFEKDWIEAKARVEQYHFTDFKFKGRHQLESIVNFFTPKRKFPVNIELYGKETFWLLSYDCAVYILNYIESNPRLKKFLRYTWGADEFIFQSIILASPFKDRVVNDNFHLVNWPPEGGSRPNFFLAIDFDRILASDCLFGRKFDIATDAKIFDLLDEVNNK